MATWGHPGQAVSLADRRLDQTGGMQTYDEMRGLLDQGRFRTLFRDRLLWTTRPICSAEWSCRLWKPLRIPQSLPGAWPRSAA